MSAEAHLDKENTGPVGGRGSPDAGAKSCGDAVFQVKGLPRSPLLRARLRRSPTPVEHAVPHALLSSGARRIAKSSKLTSASGAMPSVARVQAKHASPGPMTCRTLDWADEHKEESSDCSLSIPTPAPSTPALARSMRSGHVDPVASILFWCSEAHSNPSSTQESQPAHANLRGPETDEELHDEREGLSERRHQLVDLLLPGPGPFGLPRSISDDPMETKNFSQLIRPKPIPASL
uniref:Uncharacterized protein n=1 Tax=Rhizochromulina marina TaxID=1034831 RepID=A0A7S2S811_9STRA|eukprot:CAMPEP_0118979176 /NCGR_PEP_ID=MMETSP1173-20130426/25346_1 /TAXON_ID=1034831 /ORGANISM="Rhizochromulina marina cf, Strain CCMP1243" /LENGTH=234 /DNA_ID=CAMNT_0006929421 /DNA_START=30 /DNA_END=734 /DNA_ORIENTATION=-